MWMKTRVELQSFNTKSKYITTTRNLKVRIPKIKQPQTRSLITFCNAIGNVILQVCVSPTTLTKKGEKKVKIPIMKKKLTKGDILNRAYVWNKTGWITKDV